MIYFLLLMNIDASSLTEARVPSGFLSSGRHPFFLMHNAQLSRLLRLLLALTVSETFFLTVIKYAFIYFVESEGCKKIIAKVDTRQTERCFRSPVTLEFI